MDSAHNIRGSLLNFVINELLNGDSIDQDENLLADGVVDSLGMMRLVVFIQETTGFAVPPEDFTIENFRTVDAVGDYLDRQPLPRASDNDGSVWP